MSNLFFLLQISVACVCRAHTCASHMIYNLTYKNVFFRVEKQFYTVKPEKWQDSFSKRVYVLWAVV